MRSSVAALLAVAKDGDSTVRYCAVHSLGQIGEPAKRAAPVLVEALKDEDAEVRRTTIWALPRLKLDARATVKLLEPMLDDGSAYVRLETAAALWEIVRDRRAVTVLIRELESRDSIVRFLALDGLTKVGKDAKGAVPRLVEMLKDEDDLVAKSAREALKRIDPVTAAKQGIH